MENYIYGDEMKHLYKARSDAVHSGVLPSKSKVDLDVADQLVVAAGLGVRGRGAGRAAGFARQGGLEDQDSDARCRRIAECRCRSSGLPVRSRAPPIGVISWLDCKRLRHPASVPLSFVPSRPSISAA